MGKQKQHSVFVQLPTYASREAFLLCETEGCKNVIAAWAIPDGYSGPVTCTKCTFEPLMAKRFP